MDTQLLRDGYRQRPTSHATMLYGEWIAKLFNIPELQKEASVDQVNRILLSEHAESLSYMEQHLIVQLNKKLEND